MVRTLQTEEGVVSYFEGLVKRRSTTAEVGVLLGKWAVGSKDVLLATAPTPAQDGAPAVELVQLAAPAAKASGSSGKKPSAPSYQVRLDQDWVAEHANQVNRMLPGGLAVLGLYLFAPEAAFAPAALHLCSALASMRGAAAALLNPPDSSGGGGGGITLAPGDADGMLLLHVDSGSARLTARACPAAAASAAAAVGALKPCEVRPGRAGTSLVRLTCRHTVQHTADVGPGPATLQQLLQRAVEAEAARVAAAAAGLGGALCYGAGGVVGPEDSGASVEAAAVDALAADAAEVQLYAAPACCPVAGASSSPASSLASSGAQAAAAGGSYSLTGVVHGVAFVYRRDPVRKAVAEVKADICKSLRVRAELLADEAAEEAAAAAEAGGAAAAAGAGAAAGAPAAAAAHPLLLHTTAGKAVEVGLPRRVLLPWVAGLQVCDYLQHVPGADAAGECAEACEHAAELLSLEGVQPSQVVEAEAPAARRQAAAAKKKAAAVVGVAVHSGGASPPGLACTPAVMAGAAASAAVAVLAVALALASMGP